MLTRFLLVNIIFDSLTTTEILAVPFHQPRFRPNATWNSIATTFGGQSFVGTRSCGIFIDINNSIYMLNIETGEIHIWQNENALNPTKTISSSSVVPMSLFVTTNGDIYVENGYSNGRVDKWIAKSKTWILAMNIEAQCFGFFVDIYDGLYCSMFNSYRVDKKWSNGITTIVAGTGVEGSTSDMLNKPWGIVVDINLDLYVADCYNHRIQLFRLNQQNGITVAGTGSAKVTIDLRFPTGITLDGDQHLFIVDSWNHRIIGSDENGFRCIFACSGEQGSTKDKLSGPISMSFDSYGNIYVTDRDNSRVQKIFLSKKSDRKCENCSICFLLLTRVTPNFTNTVYILTSTS